jgi:hypothetical protein
MAVHPGHRLHPIRVIHALGCLAMACWFGWYAWQNHPARVAFRAGKVVRGQVARLARGNPGPFLPAEFEERLALLKAALPDVLGGLVVLFLFSLGTGIYVRQFEVWLEAHQAGEAAALRGVGLDRAALGANKDRKKGAVL